MYLEEEAESRCIFSKHFARSRRSAHGYVSAFTTSTYTSYKFTTLCLDPGTADIVIVGQEMTSSGLLGVVERLIPPASGSGTAALDISFNPGGPTPGIVTLATPDGNNSPTLYGCSVVDEGAKHSGEILVGGVDDATSSSLVLVGKISSSGSFDTTFGTNGVSNTRWTASAVPVCRRKSPTSASAAPTPMNFPRGLPPKEKEMIEAVLSESGGRVYMDPLARLPSSVCHDLLWNRRSGRSRWTRIASKLQIYPSKNTYSQ